MIPDYPPLYKAADRFSKDAQKRYYQFIFLKLLMLLGLAAIASVSWVSIPSLRSVGVVFAGVILVGGLSVETLISKRRYDHGWFRSRSLAESVKTHSWFYMMRIAPYDHDLTMNSNFLNTLEEIKRQTVSLPPQILSESAKGSQIPDYMKEVRKKDFEERKKIYVEGRIKDQSKWYANRGLWNSRRESVWTYASVGLQTLAALFAIALIVLGSLDVTLSGFTLPVNPIGLLTTASAAVLTWTQAKRFGELSQSYGLIASELSILQERAAEVKDDAALGDFVVNVERTISREHTLWIVRRLDESRLPATTGAMT
jgi:hypothetical protein